MSSMTDETRTMNTPQPYGSSELSGPGRSTSGVDAIASPEPSTHGVGPATATSKTSIMSGQDRGGQSQSPATSQNFSQGQIQSHGQDQTGNQGGRKDTNGIAEPAEEEGGAARGEGTNAAEGGIVPPKDTGPEGGYPEQLHAGKLDGPGPEYGKMHRVTMGDRLQGVKEEIKGVIKHDPELKKTGKQRMTGELKRKQHDSGQNMDPFQTANNDEEKKDDMDEEGTDAKKHRTEKTDEPGLTEQPQAHPTEKGREEQAASVQPEGSG